MKLDPAITPTPSNRSNALGKSSSVKQNNRKLKSYSSSSKAPVNVALSTKTDQILTSALNQYKGENVNRSDLIQQSKLELKFWKGLDDEKLNAIVADLSEN